MKEPQAERPPTKLSALIRLAIEDARKLDRTKYRPNSKVWHRPTPNGTCEVCLAGATLASRLGTENERTITTLGSRDHAWSAALIALNEGRRGQWVAAQRLLDATDRKSGDGQRTDAGRSRAAKALLGVPAPKHQNWRSWKTFDRHLAEMRDLADRIEALGF